MDQMYPQFVRNKSTGNCSYNYCCGASQILEGVEKLKNIPFVGTGWDWNHGIWKFSAQFQLSIGKRLEREIRPACDCDFQSTLFSFSQKWKRNKSSSKRANYCSLWIIVTYDSLLRLLRMNASDKERFALAINTKAQCRCLTKADQET